MPLGLEAKESHLSVCCTAIAEYQIRGAQFALAEQRSLFHPTLTILAT